MVKAVPPLVMMVMMVMMIMMVMVVMMVILMFVDESLVRPLAEVEVLGLLTNSNCCQRYDTDETTELHPFYLRSDSSNVSLSFSTIKESDISSNN